MKAKPCPSCPSPEHGVIVNFWCRILGHKWAERHPWCERRDCYADPAHEAHRRIKVKE